MHISGKAKRRAGGGDRGKEARRLLGGILGVGDGAGAARCSVDRPSGVVCFLFLLPIAGTRGGRSGGSCQEADKQPSYKQVQNRAVIVASPSVSLTLPAPAAVACTPFSPRGRPCSLSIPPFPPQPWLSSACFQSAINHDRPRTLPPNPPPPPPPTATSSPCRPLCRPAPSTPAQTAHRPAS